MDGTVIVTMNFEHLILTADHYESEFKGDPALAEIALDIVETNRPSELWE